MGAGLCLVELDRHGLEKTLHTIDQQGGTPTLIVDTDAADKANIDRVVAKTMAQFGTIDFLVNCAGSLRRTAFTEMTLEEWDLVMHVNLRGDRLSAHRWGGQHHRCLY